MQYAVGPKWTSLLGWLCMKRICSFTEKLLFWYDSLEDSPTFPQRGALSAVLSTNQCAFWCEGERQTRSLTLLHTSWRIHSQQKWSTLMDSLEMLVKMSSNVDFMDFNLDMFNFQKHEVIWNCLLINRHICWSSKTLASYCYLFIYINL